MKFCKSAIVNARKLFVHELCEPLLNDVRKTINKNMRGRTVTVSVAISPQKKSSEVLSIGESNKSDTTLTATFDDDTKKFTLNCK